MILTKLTNQFGKIRHLTLFDKEVKDSKHIPISHFVTPEIFSTKNGELGATLAIEGTSFDVKSLDEQNHLQATLGFVLQSLGDEFAVYTTTYRHQKQGDLKGEYPAGFSQDFSDTYNAQFKQSQLFVNDLYLTLMLKSGSTQAKKGIEKLARLSIHKDEQNAKEWHEKQLRKFKTALINIKTALAPYSSTVLGNKEHDTGLPEAEVLSFLSILVNGQERPYTYPQQDIASFITDRRKFFGHDTVHFQGQTHNDDLFGAMLSVKTYAPYSIPGLLDPLLTTPFEYIATHSFLGIDKSQALNMIDLQIRRLQSVGDAAQSQINDLAQAKDDLASGKISYGFHHNTILVLSWTANDLEEKIAKVIKIYQDKRLVVIRETINLESAFWAQIPGNFKYIRRSAPISTNNFSCFCSLHNYYTGYIDKNHLGSALMLVETPSKTPLYFNLHEKASGRKDDLPKGHTLLIGPSNAGKTVIMTAIDAMMQKYNIRSFFFDRNYGMEIYVRAMGGIYNRLIPGESTGWNPCQLEDTSTNRKFLRDFLEVLSSSETQPLTANDINQIAEVIDRNYSLPFEKRNLSNIASFFRADFSGLEALSRYLRLSDRTGRAGDRAYLFDNDTDTLNLNVRTMGFDMTHWLSDAGQTPPELLPISMYLFHRMELCLDGRLTGLYLDEGWQVLSEPYWQKKLDEFIVTLRKRNCFIFFGSQLPDKIARSPIASALIQGSATHIFLANPKAEEKDYMGSFKLSRREFEIIRTTSPQSRYFLLKQGQEAAVARINLAGMEDYLSVLSGNDSTISLCQEIIEEVGEDSAKWLPLFYQRRVQ